MIRWDSETWHAGAYGQYMSSKSHGLLGSDRFKFGPSKWEFKSELKAQASAIRPVLDSEDANQSDPVYPAFSNIR